MRHELQSKRFVYRYKVDSAERGVVVVEQSMDLVAVVGRMLCVAQTLSQECLVWPILGKIETLSLTGRKINGKDSLIQDMSKQRFLLTFFFTKYH